MWLCVTLTALRRSSSLSWIQIVARRASRRGEGPRELVEPWQPAKCSRSVERDVQEVWQRLVVLKALGNHTQGKGLNARNGLVTVRAVR